MFKRMALAALAITCLLAVGCSENSTNPIQPADTVPPLAPIMIGASANDGIVTASWETNTEADLAGYRLYMNSNNGPVSVSQPLIQNTYVVFDSNGDGGAVAIYATAIDHSGNESSASQTISVDLHAIRNSSRNPVEDLKDGK